MEIAPQPVADSKRRKALLIGLAMIVIIALALVFLRDGRGDDGTGTSNVPIDVVLSVDPARLPSGFEEMKVPVEQNVPVLENYNMRIDGGKGIQSARSYISEKKVDEVATAYRNYFRESGWKLLQDGKAGDGVWFLAQLETYAGVQMTADAKPIEGLDGKTLVEVHLVRRDIGDN